MRDRLTMYRVRPSRSNHDVATSSTQRLRCTFGRGSRNRGCGGGFLLRLRVPVVSCDGGSTWSTGPSQPTESDVDTRRCGARRARTEGSGVVAVVSLEVRLGVTPVMELLLAWQAAGVSGERCSTGRASARAGVVATTTATGTSAYARRDGTRGGGIRAQSHTSRK